MGINILPSAQDIKDAWSDPLATLGTFYSSFLLHPVDSWGNVLSGDPTQSQIHDIAVETAPLDPNTGAPTAQAIQDQQNFITRFIRKYGAASTAAINTDNLPNSFSDLVSGNLFFYLILALVAVFIVLLILEKL